MDVHSRHDLELSLAQWKKKLAAAEKDLSAAQKASEALRQRVQVAKASVDLRNKQIAKLPGPRRRAISYMLMAVGTTESPAGSNRGPRIDQWQKRFHMQGQPWCGALVGNAIEFAGGDVTDRIVYTPYIYLDAEAHRYGLDGVAYQRGHIPDHTHTGDLVLFDFGTPGGIKHVGMLREPWPGRGPVKTVEGNTSFGPGGSQDNGGAVARRERDPSLVHSIVRVKWPS
jgi:hypothetical protein